MRILPTDMRAVLRKACGHIIMATGQQNKGDVEMRNNKLHDTWGDEKDMAQFKRRVKILAGIMLALIVVAAVLIYNMPSNQQQAAAVEETSQPNTELPSLTPPGYPDPDVRPPSLPARNHPNNLNDELRVTSQEDYWSPSDYPICQTASCQLSREYCMAFTRGFHPPMSNYPVIWTVLRYYDQFEKTVVICDQFKITVELGRLAFYNEWRDYYRQVAPFHIVVRNRDGELVQGRIIEFDHYNGFGGNSDPISDEFFGAVYAGRFSYEAALADDMQITIEISTPTRFRPSQTQEIHFSFALNGTQLILQQ